MPSIEQYYYDVKRKDKTEVLTRLLDYYNPKLSLVFCNTKKMVDELSEELKSRGYMAEGLHGDMKQAQRDRVMKAFRSGRVEILIATDVASQEELTSMMWKQYSIMTFHRMTSIMYTVSDVPDVQDVPDVRSLL